MKELKRFDVWSVARIAGISYAMMGLLLGGVFSFISLLGLVAGAGGSNGNPVASLLFGVGAIVGLPIFYGVLGLVFAAISAAIYNLIAGMVGGIKFEIA